PAAGESVSRGARVDLRFRVTNLAGHKLPTGYPEGRRVWLRVVSPELVLRRGEYDPQTGMPADAPGRYEVKQGQSARGVPGHRLALNVTIFYDSRIPPKGMAVTATTAPIGKTYPEVGPGVLANADEVTVTATVPCSAA